jgi:hypothetical protein
MSFPTGYDLRVDDFFLDFFLNVTVRLDRKLSFFRGASKPNIVAEIDENFRIYGLVIPVYREYYTY